jgi:hypothetical protein
MSSYCVARAQKPSMHWIKMVQEVERITFMCVASIGLVWAGSLFNLHII